jgi:hypothetical protein
MAYIGRDTDKLSNIEVLDAITFDGSSSYTLQKNSVNFTPSSANNVLVSIDGVVQANNFTVSGSTIDFGVAVPGTSTCDWIYHIGVGLITTPADGTVGISQLSATGTKDATTFLRGDNTFATAGGTNTPAFLAYATANQTGLNHNTVYKITFNAEKYDTDNVFDSTTNYRFTVPSGGAGKYYLYAQAPAASNAVTKLRRTEMFFYVNGTADLVTYNDFQANDIQVYTETNSGVLDLSVGDYVEVYIRIRTSDSSNSNELYARNPQIGIFFGGYKLTE